GFANGYDSFGFGNKNNLPPTFEESSVAVASTGESLYTVYPLGEDGTGPLGDITNSPSGEAIYDGSDDAVSVVSDAWDPGRGALGKVRSVFGGGATPAPGELLPNGALIEFGLNLDLPGVADYLRQQLAIGQLGVSLSSLHSVSGAHGPGGPQGDFPAYYSKEHPAVINFGVPAAQLELDVTILPELIAGDYNRSGSVDVEDYLLWKSQYGFAVGSGLENVGAGADGNGDGVVDAADYTFWRNRLEGAGVSGGLVVSPVATVPEPGTWLMVI